jgi:hypothetical protein
MNHFNSIHTVTPYLRPVLISSTSASPQGSHSFRFSNENICISLHDDAAYIIFLDILILIIFGKLKI